jgi:hypothetical protein
VLPLITVLPQLLTVTFIVCAASGAQVCFVTFPTLVIDDTELSMMLVVVALLHQDIKSLRLRLRNCV